MIRNISLVMLVLCLSACGGSGTVADLENASVETLVDKGLINIGETFKVTCVVTNPDGKEINTDTMFEVSPGEGVEIDRDEVKPSLAGQYEVKCVLPEVAIEDETPEIVLVTLENITAVETALDDNTVVAGKDVQVTCTVKNKDGEAVEWDTEVLVEPAAGLEQEGHTLKTQLQGEYAVACVAKGLPIVDQTPEILTVSAGLPALVRATIKEETVQAGTEVPVLCTVEDVHGNALDFGTVIDPQEGIVVEETSIIPMLVGEYDIFCSPTHEDLASLEKISDHLIVEGGELAMLLLTPKPKKNFYAVGDKVSIEVAGADEYGNVVEEGLDAIVQPPEGMAEDGDKYEFLSEGEFLFMAHLEEPLDDVTGELVLICDESGPEIVMFKPERGATLDGEKMVSVEGNVLDAGNNTVELDINGISVPVDAEGNFFHVVDADLGMNMLEVKAWDGFGIQSKVVQSFFYSTDWVDYSQGDIDNALLEKSLVVFLGQNFLDDGDHDKEHIDDVATLVELILDSLELDLLLGGEAPIVDTEIPGIINFPLSFQGFEFNIQGGVAIQLWIDAVSFASPYVSILTKEGGIDMLISFSGSGEDPGVFLQYTIGLAFTLEVSSSLGGQELFSAGIAPGLVVTSIASVETLLVETSLSINKNVGEELSVSVGNLSVDLAGIHFEPLEDLLIDLGPVLFNDQEIFTLPEIPLGDLVSGINDFLNENIIDPVLNFIIPTALDLLEPIIETTVSSLLADLLNQFEFTLPIPIPELPGSQGPVELQFKTKLSSVHFHPDGGELSLATGFMAEKGVDREVLGSLLRAGCLGGNHGEPLFDSAEKMALAAHQDMVNELLFSLWWAGGLALSLDESVFGGIDLGGFGLTNLQVATDFWLPPLLNDCTAKGMVEVQIGDLLIKPSFSLMGAPVAIEMFMTAALDATMFGQGNEIGLEILGFTEVGTQIVKIDGDLGPLGGMFDIEELVENILVPMIVEQVSNLSLGSFPLPEIDLGTLLPGIPPGTTLSLGNLVIDMHKGYLLIGGELL
jgi:hypothetical protein